MHNFLSFGRLKYCCYCFTALACSHPMYLVVNAKDWLQVLSNLQHFPRILLDPPPRTTVGLDMFYEFIIYPISFLVFYFCWFLYESESSNDHWYYLSLHPSISCRFRFSAFVFKFITFTDILLAKRMAMAISVYIFLVLVHFIKIIISDLIFSADGNVQEGGLSCWVNAHTIYETFLFCNFYIPSNVDMLLICCLHECTLFFFSVSEFKI